MFSRANIDEVETDVVEIEAKLDKVRRDIITVSALYLSAQLPPFAATVSRPSPVSKLLVSATCCVQVQLETPKQNAEKTNHPTYLE